MKRALTGRFLAALAAVLLIAAAPGLTLGQTTGANAERLANAPSDTGTAPSSSGVAAAHAFYVRAGFFFDGSEPTRFRDEDCSSTSPAALYGCGDGMDGAPLGSLGDFGTTGGIDLGLGYVTAAVVRLEAMVQHHPRVPFKGQANFTQLQLTDRRDVSAELSTLTGMLAAYVDLPALGLPQLGPFAPFVGAGAGVSRIRIGETHQEFPRTRTIVPGGRRTGFAWMATAGLAVPLGEEITLDVAYRYTDHGTVTTGKATGRVEWRDRRREPIFFPLARTKAELRRNGWVVSLRYAF